MATIHVRNVPTSVYEALRKRAAQSGRSLNAEVVHILEAAIGRDRRRARVTAELRRLAREIDLPPEAPKPEDLIREMRDAAPRGL